MGPMGQKLDETIDVEVNQGFTEEELLENLAKINPAWGDAFMYEAQIEKL
jgi:hypothetical protein